MTTLLLRALAILIAIAAAIDPAVASLRRSKPVVSVIAAHSAHAQLADRVARELDDDFTVLRVPFSGVAGSVLVGDQLPSPQTALAAPVFALVPERNDAAVTLQAVTAASRTQLNARTPITVSALVTGARGRRLELSLEQGDAVLDRLTRVVAADSETISAALTLVPAVAGAMPLRVRASVEGASSAVGDLLVDVRDDRFAVLFFDARPSWQSTFVRRAVEADPRFRIASRVVTSRSASVDEGSPPQSLDELAALRAFDAIVVGAPEALNDGDAAGLDAYMRSRGGSVVLLFDQAATGAHERLTAVNRWESRVSSTPVSIAPGDGDSSVLRAASLIWPAVLPAGAVTIASDSAGHAVIWRASGGAGRLVVVGALDAWRYRDPAVSGFEKFWQTLTGEIAAAAPEPIDISIAKPMMAPGDGSDIVVTLRDLALAGASPAKASVSALVESTASRDPLRLWPSGSTGEFRGSFRAPEKTGTYRIIVSSDGTEASASFAVIDSVSTVAPDQRALLSSWTAALGGATVSASQLDRLPDALQSALRPVARRETWHPMRSPWWILPFALALAGEWWLRRRRGLP